MVGKPAVQTQIKKLAGGQHINNMDRNTKSSPSSYSGSREFFGAHNGTYNKSVLTLAIKANKFIKGSSLKQSAPNVQFRHVTPGHLEGNERAN